MKLMLHDVILATAGEPHPEARTRIAPSARDRWAAAMRGHLSEAPAGGGWLRRRLRVAGHDLTMAAARHGASLAAVWGAGAAGHVVAASLLLPGRDPSDDDDAVNALRRLRPALPLDDNDYRAIEAMPRPCVVTVYLDARWYDNARVELLATALALASLGVPDAGPHVAGEQARSGPVTADPTPPAQPPAHPPVPPSQQRPVPTLVQTPPLPFNFTRDRLRVVMGMVAKKTTAALQRKPGAHFTLLPPDEFRARPDVLAGQRLFDELKDTVWRVRWFDRDEDRLCFGDLLGFLDQVRLTEAALPDVSRRGAAGQARPDESAPGQSAHPQPVRLRFAIDTRQLVTDANIRRLLGGTPVASDAD